MTSESLPRNHLNPNLASFSFENCIESNFFSSLGFNLLKTKNHSQLTNFENHFRIIKAKTQMDSEGKQPSIDAHYENSRILGLKVISKVIWKHNDNS